MSINNQACIRKTAVNLIQLLLKVQRSSDVQMCPHFKGAGVHACVCSSGGVVVQHVVCVCTVNILVSCEVSGVWWYRHIQNCQECAEMVINPRRACAARVTCVCVCQCVQAAHPLLTQLQDQVDIPMDSVSCSLVFKKGVFRIMASFRR